MNTLGDLIKVSTESKQKKTEVILPLYLSLRDRYGEDWCRRHLIVLVNSTERRPKRGKSINYKRAKNGERTRTSEQNK